MPRYIAFLRAINVGRGRSLKMQSLRQSFESLGFSNIETFIASGNVIFEASSKSVKSLQRTIARVLQEKLGYKVAVFIRTEAELASIANYRPFPQAKIESAAEFNILLLADRLDRPSRQNVMELQTNTNEFRIREREIYWLRQKMPGKSSFSTVPFQKALGKQFTIRSANTVKKLPLKLARSKHD